MINVLDVNDNDPVFTGVNEGSVMENVGPNQNVMKVTAIDKDSGTIHVFEMKLLEDSSIIDKNRSG